MQLASRFLDDKNSDPAEKTPGDSITILQRQRSLKRSGRMQLMDLALEEGTRATSFLAKSQQRSCCLRGMDATFGLVDLGNSCCQALAGVSQVET